MIAAFLLLIMTCWHNLDKDCLSYIDYDISQLLILISSATLSAKYLYDVTLLICCWDMKMVHNTASRKSAQKLKAEARVMIAEALALAEIAGMELDANAKEAQASKMRQDTEWLQDKARLEDLTVREEPLVKQTKKGERTYYRWVASWREGGRCRKVYLGSCRKMGQAEALQKARELKARALGTETR